MMMMRMQQDSHGFLVLLLLVFIAGTALSGPSTPRRSRVRRQNMKVRINATGDTIVMKFLRPNADTKLEGYILGYGSSMFSKQFIPLPENGEPYETEFDAEPKYLIAVQPIPTNDVKKHCTGKVELQKPLHLVIGSVTPTSVLLSWGTLLKTPHEGNIMNDCVEDGHYTVRYRERSRKWNYQTCPTSDTVIDNLKPNTVYEFGVQPSAKDVTGMWSKPVIHNISSGGLEKKAIRKILKRPLNPVKPMAAGPRSFPFVPRHVLHNKTQSRLPISRSIASKTTLGGVDLSRSVLPPFLEIPLGPKVHPTLHITPPVVSVPVSHTNVDKHGVYPQHRPQPKPKPTSQYITQTKPISKLIPQTQPQPKPASKRIPQTKPKPQPTSKFIPQTDSKPKPTSKLNPQTQPQPHPTSKLIPKTQPQPHPTSKLISKTQPQPHPTSKLTPQTQPQPHPTSKLIHKTQPQPHPTLKLIPQTQPQPHPTSKFTPQTQPQPQPTSKPISQTQPQPHPTSKLIPKTKPTSKPIPQTEPQSQPTSKRISQTQPQPQPTSKPMSQVKHEPQPKSELIPQTQPQPRSQTVTQTQPQPQTTSVLIPQTQPQSQSTSHPTHQTQPQSQQTSHPVPQTQPQPQTTSQPISHNPSQTQPQSQPKFHTRSQSQSQQKFNIQPEPKNTTQLWADAQSQTTLHLKHQDQHKTQPQIKTQTPLQPHAQPSPQPTYMAHAHTPSPTLQHIPHTQQALPMIHIQPHSHPQSSNTPQPQTQTHPQPMNNPQSKLNAKGRPKVQPASKPKIKSVQPKPKLQPKSVPKSEPKVLPKTKPSPQSITHQKKQRKHQQMPKTMDKQQTKAKTPQSQPPPKTQTQSKPEPLPKPQPTSKSRSNPQLGPPLQPQTRTYSEPTQANPRHTVPTAPSPAEEGKPLPRPALATERAGSYNLGAGIHRPSKAEVPRTPISSSIPTGARNNTLSRTRIPPHSTGGGVRTGSSSKTLTSSRSSSTPGAADGVHHRPIALPKPVVWSKENPVLQPPIPVNKRPNLVGKPTDHDKPMDLKQGDKESILKPFPLVTAKPKQERRQPTTTSAPAVNSSHFDIYENSSIFRPLPASDLDIMGKKRFVAPHVIYKTDKKPDEPCSITSSLSFFPEEEGSDQNVTTPPRIPPSNLTVVTVEGCPSFVILDWQKTDNETREYEVVSTAKGPNGQEVSILTTNQTHTAVENLKPESNYEFKVTPKNELGTGPSSDPVTFSTESADPRVSEYVAGKDAIWTQFPFKSDAYSECNGKQYVKRTWYRKFVGIQLCNSLRYKLYLSDSLNGKFYNIGDQTGHGEDHCQFVDSFLDGRTGTQMFADQLPSRLGFYRALRQEPVQFGDIGGKSHVTYVGWYECGTPIPGKW
ncbi:target of Nesh-SH3 isoform X2 [Pleuronectes platessa]|uniref:target of Nesh-SH3 isoform X2 n=1 Tax=Pleuronectes platessa TaxID=8262 RepID=UPI00232A0B6A|nr:target of Nesh-SH3 isoform X2 [Pleuronectes platessa]